MIRQAIVSLLRVLLVYELGRYSLDVGKLWILSAPSQLEPSCLIEQYWEDELAINGTNFPEDYTSKQGLWTNDEFKGNLRISHVLERSGPT